MSLPSGCRTRTVRDGSLLRVNHLYVTPRHFAASLCCDIWRGRSAKCSTDPEPEGWHSYGDGLRVSAQHRSKSVPNDGHIGWKGRRRTTDTVRQNAEPAANERVRRAIAD